MKKLLVSMAVITLFGCVNMQELRDKKPDFTISSTKPTDVVSNCILNEWQKNVFSYGNVFIQDYISLKDGKTIYSESQSEIADVYSDNGVTHINFYHQKALFSYRVDGRINGIKRCL
jgi:basic membrane lipoprotein Med (substrate-binding protein (PBP1-ABC) superfamily)